MAPREERAPRAHVPIVQIVPLSPEPEKMTRTRASRDGSSEEMPVVCGRPTPGGVPSGDAVPGGPPLSERSSQPVQVEELFQSATAPLTPPL